MKAKTVLQFASLLAFAASSVATRSVRAESTESVNAVAVESVLKPPPEFTWMEFGQSTFGPDLQFDVLIGSPYCIVGNSEFYYAAAPGGAVVNRISSLLPARSLD
jgi:hypothetical protein